MAVIVIDQNGKNHLFKEIMYPDENNLFLFKLWELTGIPFTQIKLRQRGAIVNPYCLEAGDIAKVTRCPMSAEDRLEMAIDWYLPGYHHYKVDLYPHIVSGVEETGDTMSKIKSVVVQIPNLTELFSSVGAELMEFVQRTRRGGAKPNDALCLEVLEAGQVDENQKEFWTVGGSTEVFQQVIEHLPPRKESSDSD